MLCVCVCFLSLQKWNHFFFCTYKFRWMGNFCAIRRTQQKWELLMCKNKDVFFFLYDDCQRACANTFFKVKRAVSLARWLSWYICYQIDKMKFQTISKTRWKKKWKNEKEICSEKNKTEKDSIKWLHLCMNCVAHTEQYW